jgi:hypothetical protein
VRGTLRVVKLSQGSWPLAGGSPAASHFSCLAKKSNQKKATPPSPNSRKPSPPGGRQRTRPAFDVLNWFFVSGTQTPLPLIHPAGSVFGGAERGERQNQGGDDCAFTITIWDHIKAHYTFGLMALHGLASLIPAMQRFVSVIAGVVIFTEYIINFILYLLAFRDCDKCKVALSVG